MIIESRPYDPQDRPAFDEWVEVDPAKVASKPVPRRGHPRLKLIGIGLALAAVGMVASAAVYLLARKPVPHEAPAKPLTPLKPRSAIHIYTPTLKKVFELKDPKQEAHWSYAYRIEADSSTKDDPKQFKEFLDKLKPGDVPVKEFGSIGRTSGTCTIHSLRVNSLSVKPTVQIDILRDKTKGGSFIIDRLPAKAGGFLDVPLADGEVAPAWINVTPIPKKKADPVVDEPDDPPRPHHVVSHGSTPHGDGKKNPPAGTKKKLEAKPDTHKVPTRLDDKSPDEP